MKRPIKFRAWDWQQKKMVPVDVLYMRPDGSWAPNGVFDPPFPVMQSTGIHDKNGKEIYEDDIIEGLYHADFSGVKRMVRTVVSYQKFSYGMGNVGLDISTQPEFDEVIGNIHENQDLLLDRRCH